MDLGSHAIKAAQVERRRDGIAVREATVIPRRRPWNVVEWRQSSPLSSEEELVAARAAANLRGRKAAFTVPMSICDLRELAVAADNDRQRRKHIEYELQTILGSDLPPYEFDFWSSGSSGKNATEAQDRVSVMCLARDWARQIVADHGKASLSCKILDGLPLALGRAVKLALPDARGEPVAVVDWGHTVATFCLVVNGQPHFVRSITELGIGTVIEVMCRGLSLQPAEAQQILSRQGLPDPAAPSPTELQGSLADLAAAELAGLVQELERTLSYVHSRAPAWLPTQLLLFGGGATVRNVSSWLSHKLRMPVRVWNSCLERLEVSSSVTVPLEILGPAIACSCLAWE